MSTYCKSFIREGIRGDVTPKEVLIRTKNKIGTYERVGEVKIPTGPNKNSYIPRYVLTTTLRNETRDKKRIGIFFRRNSIKVIIVIETTYVDNLCTVNCDSQKLFDLHFIYMTLWAQTTDLSFTSPE